MLMDLYVYSRNRKYVDICYLTSELVNRNGLSINWKFCVKNTRDQVAFNRENGTELGTNHDRVFVSGDLGG